MRREIEFQGALKFTILHAAALVFCLDATGYFLVENFVSGFRSMVSLVWLLFMALSWWGLGLVVLQRRGPYYRLFGVLLMAVNSVWAVWLLGAGSPDDVFRPGSLIVAVVLGGLGLVGAVHSFFLRRTGRKSV